MSCKTGDVEPPRCVADVREWRTSKTGGFHRRSAVLDWTGLRHRGRCLSGPADDVENPSTWMAGRSASSSSPMQHFPSS